MNTILLKQLLKRGDSMSDLLNYIVVNHDSVQFTMLMWCVMIVFATLWISVSIAFAVTLFALSGCYGWIKRKASRTKS